MRKLTIILITVLMFVLATMPVSASPANAEACFGQASAVFAQMGEMGEHSSQYPTPRLGLANLARLLADAGVIADDSMASLGQFVAAELGLTIEACTSQ